MTSNKGQLIGKYLVDERQVSNDLFSEVDSDMTRVSSKSGRMRPISWICTICRRLVCISYLSWLLRLKR